MEISYSGSGWEKGCWSALVWKAEEQLLVALFTERGEQFGLSIVAFGYVSASLREGFLCRTVLDSWNCCVEASCWINAGIAGQNWIGWVGDCGPVLLWFGALIGLTEGFDLADSLLGFLTIAICWSGLVTGTVLSFRKSVSVAVPLFYSLLFHFHWYASAYGPMCH